MTQTRSNRYNWDCVLHLVDDDAVTPREIGRKVAREFTIISREYAEDGGSRAEKIVFRTAYTENLHPLNHFVLDDTVIQILKKIYTLSTLEQVKLETEALESLFVSK